MLDLPIFAIRLLGVALLVCGNFRSVSRLSIGLAPMRELRPMAPGISIEQRKIRSLTARLRSFGGVSYEFGNLHLRTGALVNFAYLRGPRSSLLRRIFGSGLDKLGLGWHRLAVGSVGRNLCFMLMID